MTDVDKADKQGETALHYAARYGHAAVVSLLLSSRADTQKMSKHGNAAEVSLFSLLVSLAFEPKVGG